MALRVAQHFLLSTAARSLSLARVARMSDEEAAEAFKQIRWNATGGEPNCPRCGCLGVYRYATRALFKCKACEHQFSVTSGTIFANRKMPLRTILLAIAIFVNGAKGHSALQLSRDLDCQYKTAFVLSHKIREALAAEKADATVSGEVAVDGAYFGGYVKPANYRENRRDRRLAINQTGKRRVVVIARETHGKTLPFVFKSEARVAGDSRQADRGRLNRSRRRSGPLGCAAFALSDQAHQSPRGLFTTTTPAPIRPSRSSLAYAAPRSGRITISPGHTSQATRRKWLGARTTAAFPMASNILSPSTPRWRIQYRGSGRVIGKRYARVKFFMCCQDATKAICP